MSGYTYLADTWWKTLLEAWRRTCWRTFNTCSRIQPTSSCTSGNHSRNLNTQNVSHKKTRQWVSECCLCENVKKKYPDTLIIRWIYSTSTWGSRRRLTPGGGCRAASAQTPPWQEACCWASAPDSSYPHRPQPELQTEATRWLTNNRQTGNKLLLLLM